MKKEIPQNVAVDFSDALVSSNSLIQKALNFISAHGINNMPAEKIEIDGKDIIFNGVVDADLRTPDLAALEAHRVYIDLQVIVAGKDTFGLRNTADCNVVKKPYNPEKDVIFFSDAYASTVELTDGQIIILPPQTAHAPCVGVGKVKKAVFKIKA